ncbi:MAG: hypothetical protein JXL20_09035, partial [Deltaproteobacteria bacterium]|nr:hypothetical protein [Deltaproteobacteria bacterium]
GGFGDWSRPASAPAGENRIILFKSCFPNSNLEGNPNDPPAAEISYDLTVANAKAVYNSLLTYFQARPDKLFIVITAPPLMASETDAARAANARAFNSWLVDNWLDGYPLANVAVFDYYNVLTAVGNHHRWNNNDVEHVIATASNTAYYPSEDSHPNTTGHQKATTEFVPLLNYRYQRWQSGGGTTPLNTYYLPHIATGGEWRSLFTYVNSGTSSVNCTARFYSDTGDPLYIPIDGGIRAEWSTSIPAKGTIHTLTDPGSASTIQQGWAICECSGPVKTNLIFRRFSGSTPNAEAGVNAATTGATRFVTFAEKLTGIVLTNPSNNSATVTLTVYHHNGDLLVSKNTSLGPGFHQAFNLQNFVTIPEGFWGSVVITSNRPILSFSLNFEANPVFSALPPGED